MKTKTAAEHIARGVVLSSVMFLGVLILLPSAHAATVFYDDFEDGDTSGWMETVIPGSGGSGSTGVQDHNSSQMAFVYHQGKGEHSLSSDFNYLPDEILAFDMHAVANIGYKYNGVALHSSTGVTVSFLNFLNTSLGSISVVNATNPTSLGSSSVFVDSAQHNYNALMSQWAAQAGLDATDPISKVSLEFFATANYSYGGGVFPNGRSSATVWFDNVSIGVVPVPAAAWLFSSGLLGLIGISRRKKAA